jgi:HAD superfamily hydrolase (TIGR01549 family)
MISPKGVAFDLYGTLLHYGNMEEAWRCWASYFYDFLKARGLEADSEEFSHSCDGFFAAMPSQPPLPEYTIYEFAMGRHARNWRVELSQGEVRELADESCAVWQEFIQPDLEALTLLRDLQKAGLKTALLTNFDHTPHIYQLLESLGWDEYLDAILISAETGFKKPQREIFSLLSQKLGLEPQSLIFVGDDPEKDYHGALSAGLHPVLLKKGSGLDRLHTDFRVDMKKGTEAPGQELPSISSLKELRELLLLLIQ